MSGKENKKVDLRRVGHGVGVGILAQMLPGLVGNALSIDGDSRFGAVSDYEKVHKNVVKAGDDLKKSMKVRGTRIVYNHPVARYFGGGMATPTSHYNSIPWTHTIGKKMTGHPKGYNAVLMQSGRAKSMNGFDMGTLSHELGHVKNLQNLGKKGGKSYMRLRGTVPLMTSLATIPAIISGYNEDNKAAATAAVAMSVPGVVQLAEETIASARGLKGVAKLKGGGIKGFAKALKSGGLSYGRTGLSYGTLAAMPLFAYFAARNYKGGDKKKNDNLVKKAFQRRYGLTNGN